MPEFEVLSQMPYVWIDEDRKFVQATFVVYRDAEGLIGTIVVPKPKPSDAEIQAAVKKRAGA